MHETDKDNTIFKTAADFINNSNYPVFLTGKAGTGKTTFLKYIKEHTTKNTVIVAPTGVAAINAGGTTIHSFFQLPFGPYLPISKKHFSEQNTADKNSLLSNLKLSAERREIMELLELLVIDEVSMVRCDVLDAIDTVLRHVRRQHAKPFGGVQVLYIGDLYQLPPVIKDEEWKLLHEVYNNQYFFSSLVIAEQRPVYIELKKVYRQTDISFINLLNQVRNNVLDETGYELLHSMYQPGFKATSADNFITLTTHNNKADIINTQALSQLHEKMFSFNAAVEGSFFENSFPADETFNVKTGAQVMFLKNDMEKVRRYYNGKIGTVTKIEDDKIWVECPQDNPHQLIEVKREVWRNIKYSLNNKTQQIEEEELGSFTQFPLRLAWAITIHKSQGLTFQNAIIDAGNAFAPGQVYVALSRCTTLEGIILHSRITYNSLKSDERIVAFSLKQQNDPGREEILLNATRQYQQEVISGLFSFKSMEASLSDLYSWININNTLGSKVINWLSVIKQTVTIFTTHSEKFAVVLNEFFRDELVPSENIQFQDRFKKAANWFSAELLKLKKELLQSPAVTDNRQLAKDYNLKIQKLFDIANNKIHLLGALKNGFSLSLYAEQKAQFKTELFPVNAYAGKSNYISQDILYADLYAELKAMRDEIATTRGVPVYMVCKTQSLEEMTKFLPCTTEQLGIINGFGKVKIKQFGNDFINIIKAYCELKGIDNSNLVPDIKKPGKIKIPSPVKPGTKKVSFDLFKLGKSIAEIAVERNLSVSTIEGHMTHFIESGEMDIYELIETRKYQRIIEKLSSLENRSIQFLKEEMPFASYSELRWVIAAEKKASSVLKQTEA